MTGPCLCGDPYCPSCGDPGAAAAEAFADSVVDELMKLSEEEARIFVKAGRQAVENVNEYLRDVDMRRNQGELF